MSNLDASTFIGHLLIIAVVAFPIWLADTMTRAQAPKRWKDRDQ